MDALFLGAAGTVTGSKTLVTAGGRRVLVDCGIFQGYKHLRERNWQSLPVPPADIDAVVLTHAHVDHAGWLPVLCRQGFRGRVHCTPATRDLSAILLPDSGKLQEEEARLANLHGWTKHRPARPLYTQAEAEACLERFALAPYDATIDLGGGLSARLRQAGHILGAAMVHLRDGRRSLLFTGDLGRPNDPIMRAPARVAEADALVLESTYGDRSHGDVDPLDEVAEVVNRAAARQGVVIVPAFAVGRAQAVLHALHALKAAQRIPDVPVFLDSPMAVDVSELYANYGESHRLGVSQARAVNAVATYVNSGEESKAIDRRGGPMIVISAAGMATGGRVLHHLKTFAPDPRNVVMFTGFQAGGTRGRDMVEGATEVKIHGAWVKIGAEVVNVGCLSAHADRGEILEWLRGFTRPPGQVLLNHGEPAAAEALRRRIADSLGWNVRAPQHGERVEVP